MKKLLVMVLSLVFSFNIFGLNYLTVWNITEKDQSKIQKVLPKQKKFIKSLFDNYQAENFYVYSGDAKKKIAVFVIKSSTLKWAQKIVLDAPFVTDGVATVDVIPVGSSFLYASKSKSARNKNKTYAVVWEWEVSKLKKAREYIGDQMSAIVKLHNDGVIANAYMDNHADFLETNTKLPLFLFFLDAKNDKEAHKILKNLPFSKNEVASYKIYEVGELVYQRKLD